MCNRRRRRSKERGARRIRSQCNDQEGNGNFFAGLTSGWGVLLHSDCRQQKNREQSPADHPAERNVKRRSAKVENVIELEVADGFNQAGQHEAERKNERSAIMRTAKANESVGCVAKAEKCAADFNIEIGLIAARESSRAEIRQSCQEQNCSD